VLTLKAWTTLAIPAQTFQLIVVITSVEIEPPISVYPSSINGSSPATNAHKPGPQTPAATPSNLGVSPDTLVQTPAGTPSESAAADGTYDPESYLTDTTDETCSIILSHRPMLSTSSSDHLLSLSSAMVMKLPPSTPTTNPFSPLEVVNSTHVNCIAIHLHWARNSGKGQEGGLTVPGSNMACALPKTSADTILREYLSLFRNLALLAKIRGTGDYMAGLVPWHVLTSVKVTQGLDIVYGAQKWA
jgi:mediator of RNA polymerase II transcription subunit 13, fungi type